MYNQTLTGDVSKTMSNRATDSDHVPCVIESYAFEPGITKREGGDGRISQEVTPTLRSNMGDNQTAVAYCVDQGGQKYV